MNNPFRALSLAAPLPEHLLAQPCLQLDLSRNNSDLAGLDVADPNAFECWISEQKKARGCDWAAGGYAEDRAIYAMSPVFGDAASLRSIHLGVDLWMPAGTPVFAMADARVHSLADNARFGDYGPTVILEHALGTGEYLYSLYGHLAKHSLAGLNVGQHLKAGDGFAQLGTPDENLGWAPHLHLQLIHDLNGRQGDFPGVCQAAEAELWLAGCPDPWPLIAAWCGEIRT